jgi:hypothetical protein
MVLCKGRTELALVLHVMSLANQRHCDGKADSWTGIIQTVELSKFITCTVRMVNEALDNLVELGVLEQKSVKEARRAGLVTPEEAKASQLFGVVLRANPAAWASIAEQEIAAAEEAPIPEPPAKQEIAAAEEAPIPEPPAKQEPATSIRVVEAPVRLAAGVKGESIALPNSPIRSISFDSQLPSDISSDLVLVGDTLRVTFAESATSIDSSRQHNASADDKGVTRNGRGRNGGGKALPWANDTQYHEFIAAYATTQKPLSEIDWRNAYPPFCKLSRQEKQMAIAGVLDRVASGAYDPDDTAFIHLPENYLKKGIWARAVDKKAAKVRKRRHDEQTDEERADTIEDLAGAGF